MGKALKTAGAIIGGAVLMATGVGALAGMQVTAMGIAGVGTMSIANLQLMSAGLMAAGSMLDKPKSTASGSPSEWTSNPDQGIPFLFGRMGVAGKIVHRDEYGPDNRLQGIVTIYSGAGPVKSFQGFTADELPVSFESNGGTAIGKYRRQMWRSWRMGAQPDTALSLPTGLDGGAVMPMWGASYRLSGKACDLLTMQMDSKFSVYPTGEPKPMQVLEGVFGYDPRYDDTYPGGAGPCRYGVRSTYRYINDPITAALNWALGMIENGQVVGGIGASLQGVDLPAFVEAANIADANAWTVAAWPDTSEDASVVLDELLEAGGAKRSRVAGKISCVSRGAPRPSIVTITRRDTAGAIELDTGASRFNRLNTITPVIMSEAHKWKHAPMDPVSFASLVSEDGGKRSDQIKYRFVSKVKQGAELAAYDILDAREPFAGTIPLLPHLRRLKPGDCFDIDEPGFMLDGVKMLVLSRSYDARTGEVRIAFRSETDSKHPLALGKTTTMPEYPGLTVPDPTEVTGPLPGDWTIVVRPPAPGGGQLPGLDLTGIVSNSTATAIIVEYGSAAEGPWTQAYQGPPTVTSIPIDGLQPGATYFVAVQYQRDQNYSDRYVYGPYVAPLLDPSPNAPTITNLQGQITAAFGDIFDVSSLLADARADIDAQGVEIAAARGDQADLNSRIVQVNQARIDGDTANAEAISLVQARTAITEADLIDLENALANETTARAEAISQVSARSALRPNLIDNPSGKAAFRGWLKEGSAASHVDDDEQAGRIFVVSGYMVSQVYPAKPGDQHSLSYNASPLGDGGHIRIQYVTPGGLPEGVYVASGPGDIFSRRRSVAPSTAPSGTTGFRLVVVAPPGGELPVWAIKVNSGSVAADFSDDYSATVLEASVTQQSLAIVDLENQQNIALWRIKAEASGGRPAIIEAYSGLGTSALAFSAEQLYLGDNTVFDDATNTWQTIDGSTVYIRAEGAPFGAFSNLREWWGPTGIALGAMTPDNGYSGRMTTAPYNFTNTLNPRTFSAYASPGSIEAHRPSAGSLTSAAVSILYQNAKGAVSVTWERLIGGVTAAGTAVIDAPNALTTTFTKTVSAQERTDTLFQATLTDAGSGERRQVIVPVVFTSGAA